MVSSHCFMSSLLGWFWRFEAVLRNPSEHRLFTSFFDVSRVLEKWWLQNFIWKYLKHAHSWKSSPCRDFRGLYSFWGGKGPSTFEIGRLWLAMVFLQQTLWIFVHILFTNGKVDIYWEIVAILSCLLYHLIFSCRKKLCRTISYFAMLSTTISFWS